MPRIGVAAIITRGDQVLLGFRLSTTHGHGTWQFPGGHLEFGESVEACAVREAREETGLAVRVTARGPWVNTVFEAEGRHYVTLFVLTESLDGEPMVCEPDKCREWRWCRWDALPAPLFAPIERLRDAALPFTNVIVPRDESHLL